MHHEYSDTALKISINKKIVNAKGAEVAMQQIIYKVANIWWCFL